MKRKTIALIAVMVTLMFAVKVQAQPVHRELIKAEKKETAKPSTGRIYHSGTITPHDPIVTVTNVFEDKAEEEVIAEEPEVVSEDATSEPEYLGEWTITHYCNCESCCGQWAGDNTASGAYPTPNHTVASDLPFGTQLLIDGQLYVVEDRGVEGEWIDVYVDSHEEAIQRGMYQTSVYLVK